jgi:uncharacterized metal-binding protein YceD (DUF177 family)
LILKDFNINIVGLSNTVHHFQFEVGAAFFKHFGTELIEEGAFTVDLDLDKHETFIEIDFKIKGTARLTCDRSLDQFDYPIETENKIVFKYGDGDVELDDDIVQIDRDTARIEIGQYIFEFIGLAVPMKKLHPRFEETDMEEDELVYTSEKEKKDEEIDPRWEKLKNLNKN